MERDEALETLRRTPVLRFFEEDALRVLANVADTRRLRTFEALFRQGDRSDGGYVVMSGALDIERDGNIVATLGPGSLVGEVALFLRMQRPATAIAREMTSVLRISPTLMKRVLHEYPSAAPEISRVLSRELQAFTAGLEDAEELFAALDRNAGPTGPASP
ncbi:MAG: cyclic nucleotide-binding protein [Enterovirga sp.]|jgi:CRP-like cAMP-binding protein|nr:cyclic nucleotide-binding protein [Enterovirga sp.]